MSAATNNQIIPTEGMHPPKPPTSTIHIFYQHFIKFVTGPAKRDPVSTKYTISHNGTYLELRVKYLLFVSCKMWPIRLLTNSKNFTYIALVDL